MIKWIEPVGVGQEGLTASGSGTSKKKSNVIPILIGTVIVGTALLLFAGTLGMAGAASVRAAPTGVRTIKDQYGEPLRIGKIDGEWHYFYDREWTPLKYYGGGGYTVRGSELVAA